MVRIRLAANKGAGSYAVVAAEAKSRRDGKRAAKLGDYNPKLAAENPFRLVLDLDGILNWISKGAQPSERVARLIRQYSAKHDKVLPANVAAFVEKCCIIRPAKVAAE